MFFSKSYAVLLALQATHAKPVLGSHYLTSRFGESVDIRSSKLQLR